jgi:hypothetical protein
MITIELDNARALAALHRLGAALIDPKPFLKAIGPYLVASTKKRIKHGGPSVMEILESHLIGARGLL